MKHPDDDEENGTTPELVVHIIVDTDDKNTEQHDEKKGIRPNAYWARVREEQLEEQEGDTFSAAFRGTRPAPHGGAVGVTPDATIGTDELCWCGQPVGHDWPGKAAGAKHPKMKDTDMTTADSGTIDRREMRGFHRQLQDFVIQCINHDHLRHRITRNGVILYPPDGSTPITVNARNTDRQVRQLQKWYLEHVRPEPDDDKPADPEALKRLAEATNNPAEHPPAEPKQSQPREDEDTPRGHAFEEQTVSPNGEWVPYVSARDGTTLDDIETDGERVRCRLCAGTDHEYIHSGSRGIGGHKRMHHTDTSTLHGEEPRARATATLRHNRAVSTKVTEAINLLIEATGVRIDNTYDQKMEARLDQANKELADAKALLSESNKALDRWIKRAETAEARVEELEAKQALMREALGL